MWEAYGKRWKGNEKYWRGEDACPVGIPKNMETTLKFNEDGSFRIAIFTDLHFSCGHTCEVDLHTQLLVDSILEMERPDLVVFNGDLVQREGGSRKPSIFLDIFAPVERRGIPFAVIFGNHDSDGPMPLSREELVDLVYQCPHSIVMSPSEYYDNKGNYVRVLQGTQTIAHLLFLDTHRDSMTPSQVKWLRGEMDDIYKHVDKQTILSTLVFMHIPPKEFITKMCAKDSVCNGVYGERAEYGGKEQNTGFYNVFKTMEGSVRAIISGHDHKNDVCSVTPHTDKKNPVEVLCYARASGYGGYGHETLAKGSRIIHINEKTKSFFTYVVDDVGNRGEVLHFIPNET